MLLSVATLASCGGETIEEKLQRQVTEAVGQAAGVEIDAANIEKAMGDLASAFDSTKLVNVEVMNFRDLKPFLPATAAGLPRTEHLGETQGAMGFTISTANAVYTAGERRVSAELTDTGGAGVLMLSLGAFSTFTVDKETASGSERTFKLDGYPAYEKTSTAAGAVSSELKVLVNDRFVVTLEGQGVDAAALTGAFREMNLGSLPKAK